MAESNRSAVVGLWTSHDDSSPPPIPKSRSINYWRRFWKGWWPKGREFCFCDGGPACSSIQKCRHDVKSGGKGALHLWPSLLISHHASKQGRYSASLSHWAQLSCICGQPNCSKRFVLCWNYYWLLSYAGGIQLEFFMKFVDSTFTNFMQDKKSTG